MTSASAMLLGLLCLIALQCTLVLADDASAPACRPLRVALSCREVALRPGALHATPTSDGVAPCTACLITHSDALQSSHGFCALDCAVSVRLTLNGRYTTMDEGSALVKLGTQVLRWPAGAPMCQPVSLAEISAAGESAAALMPLAGIEARCSSADTLEQVDDDACPLSAPLECSAVDIVVTPKMKLTRSGLLCKLKQSTRASQSGDVSAAASGDNQLAVASSPYAGRRVLVTCAHADDTLLFQSPTLLRDIQLGNAVRTIFLTAGDAGGPSGYWRGREEGAMAGYASMARVANRWVTTVRSIDGRSVRVQTLADATHVSVIFLRLPDGNGDGSGYNSTAFQSMQKLWNTVNSPFTPDSLKLSVMNPVDGSASFTYAELLSLLRALMYDHQPSFILSQDLLNTGGYDHADHVTGAKFTHAAHVRYAVPHTLEVFVDYYTENLPQNVLGETYDAKRGAFLTYAPYDNGVCQTAATCEKDVLMTWIGREYVSTAESSMDVLADAGLDQFVWSGSVVRLDGSASFEQNGDTLTYRWTQLSGRNVTLSSSREESPTFVAPSTAALLQFSLTVSNGEEQSAPSTVSVKVSVPPPSDQSVNIARGALAMASSANVLRGQGASSAIDGVISGFPTAATAEWATQGQGVGAWLELRWPTAVTLSRVLLWDRPNTVDNVRAGTLSFSDGGAAVTFGALPSTGATPLALTLSVPRTSSTLRFTVTDVSNKTSTNIGLAEVQAWTPAATSNAALVATASASSQNVGTGQLASSAIDGVVGGYPGDVTAEWATQGQGVGAWLELRWPSAVTLARVLLWDRPNTADNVRAGMLSFSDGAASVTFGALPNNGASPLTITLSAPRTTSTLRITITSVTSATANIGLSEVQAWTPASTTSE